MADLSHYSDAELERMANTSSLAHMSDADLEKIAGKPAPSVLADVAQSIPVGAAKGIAGLAGLPGDLSYLVNRGMNAVGIPTRDPSKPLPDSVTVPGGELGLGANPTSAQINSQFTGGKPYYEPQTTPGKITERIASFLPAVPGGPAGLGARLMGRAVAPGIGSAIGENLGDDKSPILRSVGQIGGALLGAGAFGGARALSQGFRNAKLSPEEVAQSYVANVAQSAGKQPGDALERSLRGQTAAEALGPVGVANLAALGRRGGETPLTLAQTLKQRAAGAPERILGDYESASGIAPEAAQGNMQGIIERGQSAARPLYEEAFNATPNTSEHLERLAAQPDVRQGMSLALKNAQRRAVGKNEPFDPNAYAITSFNEAGDPVIGGVPNWRTFDMGKRGLDEMLEQYRDPITRQIKKTDSSDAIDQLRRGLVGALDEANPQYKGARASAADYLSANESFGQGQNHIINPAVTVAKAKSYFDSLSAPNQEAYKAGIANKLFNQAQNSRLKPGQLLTPAAQEKLRSVLGSEKGQEFIEGLQQELSLSQSGQRMMPGGGSITSDVLNATKEQDLSDTVRGASHFARAAGDFASNRYGSAIANALRGTYHFAPDMFRTGGMSEAARNKAGAMLMLPPDEFSQQLNALPAPRPNMGAAALAPYLLNK